MAKRTKDQPKFHVGQEVFQMWENEVCSWPIAAVALCDGKFYYQTGDLYMKNEFPALEKWDKEDILFATKEALLKAL